ncbi:MULTISPECIES: hypothetical protein [unclassified Chryseobacterium]|uniref:hypothetical protein n=1 Tax=unclassified Chryseobacterium TaxID=2593645 RepID=UPI0028532A7F|nr:hypothetical protein [Chryseobacterium sp. CFS7]MDR4892302.1 hypothetical protein [Chryseobacterium sp. CFS7]
MEEKGYIEIIIDNFDESMTPKDLDINDIKALISDLEMFLYPTREEKASRPHIAYDLQKGSAKNVFFMPISTVILFNGLTSEISKRNDISFMDLKRQEIIDKIQKKAIKDDLIFKFKSSQSPEESLVIDSNTNFKMLMPAFYESEFYLYGEVYQQGGKNPNLHITTKNYGNLTVSASRDQIANGDQKTYKIFGLKVKGKKNINDGKLSDLKLLQILTYEPEFNFEILKNAIEKASTNLSKIKDLDKWINDLKVDGL